MVSINCSQFCHAVVIKNLITYYYMYNLSESIEVTTCNSDDLLMSIECMGTADMESHMTEYIVAIYLYTGLQVNCPLYFELQEVHIFKCQQIHILNTYR